MTDAVGASSVEDHSHRARRAVGYLRVSGLGQVSGDGLQRQECAVRDYARRHRLTVIEVFTDPGVSGTKELEHREGLSRLIRTWPDPGNLDAADDLTSVRARARVGGGVLGRRDGVERHRGIDQASESPAEPSFGGGLLRRILASSHEQFSSGRVFLVEQVE